MSAPRTDIEKQARRHVTPLMGLGLSIVFGLGLFLSWLFGAFDADSLTEPLDESAPVAGEAAPDTAASRPDTGEPDNAGE